MKIKGTPKEIADLVLALQGQHNSVEYLFTDEGKKAFCDWWNDYVNQATRDNDGVGQK